MEGRIRVSVVATGIDAMDMRLPKNVEPLRPNLKPVPLRPEPRVETAVAAAASVNPVIRQREALAAEMSAASQAAFAAEPLSPEEDYILGGNDAPVVDDPIPVSIRPQPVRMQPIPQPEPERRGWGGLLGRKKPKEELRAEPVAPFQQRQVVQPRASAQPIARPQSEPQRAAPQNGAAGPVRRSEAGRAVRNPGLPAPADELTAVGLATAKYPFVVPARGFLF